MRPLFRSLLMAVLLVFSCTAALADVGQALQIVGYIVSAAGFPQIGYALIAAGPAAFGLAARRARQRRATADSPSATEAGQ
jgi:hypothetical protein